MGCLNCLRICLANIVASVQFVIEFDVFGFPPSAVFTQPRNLDSLSLVSSSSAAAAASKTGAPLLRTDSRVFMVGCGNSPFSADMYDAGFTDIANVDYAPTVIEQVWIDSNLQPAV